MWQEQASTFTAASRAYRVASCHPVWGTRITLVVSAASVAAMSVQVRRGMRAGKKK